MALAIRVMHCIGTMREQEMCQNDIRNYIRFSGGFSKLI